MHNKIVRVRVQAGDVIGNYNYSVGTFSKTLGSSPTTFDFPYSTVCGRFSNVQAHVNIQLGLPNCPNVVGISLPTCAQVLHVGF